MGTTMRVVVDLAISKTVMACAVIAARQVHHVPAAAFERAVKQVPVRRWLGLTATRYRRDKLDDLYLDNFCGRMPDSGRFRAAGG